MRKVPNNAVSLPKTRKQAIPWITENTAIMIIHGIGNQLPLETLDSFGRGLITQYKDPDSPDPIKLQHKLEAKPDGSNGIWFDNVVRIEKGEGKPYIDIYEYYWANYTEDKASTKDIQKWVNNVANGASKFYAENEELGKLYHDKSIFFDKSGNLRVTLYKFVLWFLTMLIPAASWILKLPLKFIAMLPVIGAFAKSTLQDMEENLALNIDNIIGDIVVYNVTDPKSKFYCVKRQILDGAVDALRFLMEKTEGTGPDAQLAYPNIIVAGHSLGTQVGYDAINKIDLLVNEATIKNYNKHGFCTLDKHKNRAISSQLKGFVTFGSPLDKIAFFLREMVPKQAWLRRQILDSYHSFKQQNWDPQADLEKLPGYIKLSDPVKRLFDNILWRNYFDNHDAVSGSLDYYKNLTNIDCHFEGELGGFFTHSSYWECDDFYRDIIFNYLVPAVHDASQTSQVAL